MLTLLGSRHALFRDLVEFAWLSRGYGAGAPADTAARLCAVLPALDADAVAAADDAAAAAAEVAVAAAEEAAAATATAPATAAAVVASRRAARRPPRTAWCAVDEAHERATRADEAVGRTSRSRYCSIARSAPAPQQRPA